MTFREEDDEDGCSECESYDDDASDDDDMACELDEDTDEETQWEVTTTTHIRNIVLFTN